MKKIIFLFLVFAVSLMAKDYWIFSNFTNKINLNNATSKTIFFGKAETWYKKGFQKFVSKQDNHIFAGVTNGAADGALQGTSAFLSSGAKGIESGSLIGGLVMLIAIPIHSAYENYKQAKQFLEIVYWKEKNNGHGHGQTAIESILFLSHKNKYIEHPKVIEKIIHNYIYKGGMR